MKRAHIVLLAVLVALIALTCSTEAQIIAPIKSAIKWSQPPVEVSKTTDGLPIFWGWDEPSFESANYQHYTMQACRLADDWECMTDLPVTDIHWWGSYRTLNGQGWLETFPPTPRPVRYRLEIYSDVPVSANNPYSHPGTLLWKYEACDCDINVEFVGYDRNPFNPNEVDSCFYYSVDIPRECWFYQDPGTNNIYWLAITPIYDDCNNEPINFWWGWKTRRHQFMDDAVREVQGATPPWQVIQDNWDLSFRLTTMDAAGQNIIKYEQPPIQIDVTPEGLPIFDGWDEVCVRDVQRPPKQAADDWLCEKPRPVRSIEWWGSYPGWMGTASPQPPTSFWFGIYTDVPADPATNMYSHPGNLVWQYQTSNYTETFVGYDTACEPEPGVTPALADSCFQYRVVLPKQNWFQQAAGTNVYWLSVRAQYPNGSEYCWGWKTRPHWFNDDAVRCAYNSVGWEEIFGCDCKSWDLAFRLWSFPKIIIKPHLLSYEGPLARYPVTVSLREPQTQNIVRSETFTLSSNPEDLVLEDVEPGQYDVMVECMPHWLRKIAYGVNVDEDDISLDFPLINGDLDGDNVLTIGDAGLVLWYENAEIGDPNYNPDWDVDGDGVLSIGDAGIILWYENLEGDW